MMKNQRAKKKFKNDFDQNPFSYFENLIKSKLKQNPDIIQSKSINNAFFRKTF